MALEGSPSRALLLAPLLTSTASLTYALSEVFTFLPFLNSPPSVADNTVISHYWKWFLYYGLGTVVTFNGASAVMGAIIWGKMRSIGDVGMRLNGAAGGVGVRKLAGWGAVAAFGHFAFAPSIATIVERVVKHPTDSREDLRKWLRLHAVRTIMTDIPAWLCFLAVVWHGF